MCGIYGFAGSRALVDPRKVEHQRDLLRHRGPDDAGLWVSRDGRVALAHRRLSIIDLSAAGHQPMLSSDGRLAIVFGGEIYNFRGLRAELESLGNRFISSSDTEVLLTAYRAWGTECLAKLNGMFAFVIHDAGGPDRAPSLFFARDRSGEKPFYYIAEPGFFEFASELKALSRRAGLDLNALNHYLALGYVPGEFCLSRGVRKLPPAHAGRLDLATLSLNIWRYWSPPASDPDERADPDQLAEEARRVLFDSVRLRLESDVPLGVLLSGGLDSSLVAAAAARNSPGSVKTFTITLPGSPLDESRHARTVARHFGTEHHELPLAETGFTAFDDFSPFVDEPIADSSLIPAFFVSRLTRRHVTVALGGDGGDELFGGYSDYPQALGDEALLRWMPKPALTLASRVAAALPAGVRGRNRVASLRGGALQQMIWGSPYFDIELRKRILGREAVAHLGERLDDPERGLLSLFESGKGPVDRMTRTHFHSTLPDDFLAKVDRASMANSLEVRSPFLDHRLIEFAFKYIPEIWKVSGRDTRRLERMMARKLLPPDLDIERKQGFSIPLDDWLRAAGAPALMQRLEMLPGVISRSDSGHLVRGLLRGRANGARLFALLMLAQASQNLRLQD